MYEQKRWEEDLIQKSSIHTGAKDAKERHKVATVSTCLLDNQYIDYKSVDYELLVDEIPFVMAERKVGAGHHDDEAVRNQNIIIIIIMLLCIFFRKLLHPKLS